MLSWHDQNFTQEEVSEWCGEAPGGCEFFLALQSLREEGFDVEDIDDEDVLLAVFAGPDPEPVIVMIRTPAMIPSSDHAVVIHAIQQQSGAAQAVDYMDPIVGENLQDTNGALLRYWNVNGSRAFIIRPT